jgi:hypothetical protein
MPITQPMPVGFAGFAELLAQQGGFAGFFFAQQQGASASSGSAGAGCEQQQPPVWHVCAVAQPHTGWPHAFALGIGKPIAANRYANSVTPAQSRRRTLCRSGCGKMKRIVCKGKGQYYHA